MLELTATAWRQRIAQCREHRCEHLAGYEEVVERYVGPGFQCEPAEYDPINHAQNWVSTWMPQLVYGNPRADVATSRQGGDIERDAQALEHALNRVIHQANLRQLNEQLAVDFTFWYGVALVTNEPRPGFSEFEDPPYWPTATRIPPWEFLYDHQATNWKNWRYQGHLVTRDIDDLLAEARANPEHGWNTGLLERLKAEGATKGDEGGEKHGHPRENRRELSYWEVWCPEVEAGDIGLPEQDDQGRPHTGRGGYHGACFYVAEVSGEEEYVRDPAMFWGPRTGPYAFLPGYFVPTTCLPLSALAATHPQAVYVNRAFRAVQEAIETYKRLILADSTAPDIQDAITDAPNGSVVPVRGADEIAKHVAQVEIGGLTEQLLAAVKILQENLEKASGMGDAQRGEVTGEGTATEVAVAAAASGTKLGFLALKFREGVTAILEKMAWYLWHDERAVLRLASDQGGGFYFGGARKSESIERALKTFPDAEEIIEEQFEVSVQELLATLKEREKREEEREDEDPFDALDLTIAPYSMEKTAEGLQAQRLLQAQQLFAWLLPGMVQFPFVQWGDVLDWLGDTQNANQLRRFIDFDALAQMQSAMMQMQVAPKDASAQPRVSKDQPKVTLSGGAGANGSAAGGGFKMPEIGSATGGSMDGLTGRSTGSQAGKAAKVG